MNEYQRNYDLCRKEMFDKQSAEIGAPIRLVKLSGSFAVWIGGVVIAVMAFVIERTWF